MKPENGTLRPWLEAWNTLFDPGYQATLATRAAKWMTSTAICALTLARSPAGSVVIWSMDGNHNFIGKAAGVFMNMDKMLGDDIEKGLAQLKTVAEGA